MSQEEKYQYVKNLKVELREDLLNLEIELNKKMQDFIDKWQDEKGFFRVDINPINSIHPGYDKDRGGIVQLLAGTIYPNPNKNNEY